MFRIASEKCYETNLFKSTQTIPVLVEFYPSVVVRHICRILVLTFLHFIQTLTLNQFPIGSQRNKGNQQIIIAEKKLQIKLHVAHGKTTYKCHMDDIRVHTSDILMAHEYIAVTYGWHANDMRMT